MDPATDTQAAPSTSRPPVTWQPWLLAAVLLAGVVLRLWYPFPEARSRDEQTYATFAATLRTEGVAGLQRLSSAYIQDLQRLDPPPTRVGYPALVAVAQRVNGGAWETAGSWVSTIASVATLGVAAALGVEVFGLEVAVVGTVLLAAFVPDLVIARRAWTDALGSLLTCLMLYAAVRVTKGGARRGAVLWMCATGFVFALTKETAAVVWAACLVWVLLSRTRQAVFTVGASVATGLAALATLAWVSGGPAALWDIQSRFSTFHAANPYALEYQNGPPLWLLKGFFITSPLTLLLVPVGLVRAVRLRATAPEGAFLGAFAAGFLLLPFVLPNWLSLRFASPAFVPFTLTAASGLCWGVEALAQRREALRRVALLAATVLVVLVGVRDLRYFTRWWVVQPTLDLSIKMVLGTTGELPARAPDADAVSPERRARAAQLLQESTALFVQRQFDASIAVGRQALVEDPTNADVYNNIAAAYEELGQWDNAIAELQTALRLRPDFDLARNNLRWSVEQKRKATAP